MFALIICKRNNSGLPIIDHLIVLAYYIRCYLCFIKILNRASEQGNSSLCLCYFVASIVLIFSDVISRRYLRKMYSVCIILHVKDSLSLIWLC